MCECVGVSMIIIITPQNYFLFAGTPILLVVIALATLGTGDNFLVMNNNETGMLAA